MNNAFIMNAWLSDDGIVITTVTYLTAIFSALIVVFIFKTPQEDGSELITCAKPLSRNKVIFIKFLCFVFYSIFFSIVSALSSLLGFIVPNVNAALIMSLFWSLILTHTITMLFFGSLAILFSLRFNKVLTIMFNVFFVLLGVIYSISTVAVQKNASSVITSKQTDGEMLSTTLSYTNQNNIGVRMQGFIPVDESTLTKMSCLDFAKKQWKSVMDESEPFSNQLIFNIIKQQSYIYALNDLNYIFKVKNAESSIGANEWYKYDIIGNPNPYSIKSITNATDDDYSWTNLNNKELPLMFVNTSGLSKEITAGYYEANTAEDNFFTRLAFLNSFTQVAKAENVSFISPIRYTDDSVGYSTNHQWDKTAECSTSQYYNGVTLAKNNCVYRNSQINLTTFEKDLFNYIIFNTLWNTNSEFAKCYSMSSSHWSFNPNSSNNEKYLKLIKQIFDKNKTNLKINSESEYGFEYLKLKNYMTYQLIGYYGDTDYVIQNNSLFDLDGKKIESTIIIPYNDYFNLSFKTQYNALTIRDIESYSDNLISSESDFTAKSFLANGMFALPNAVDRTGTIKNDLYNSIFSANAESTNLSKTVSTDYDGTKTPVYDQYDDLYKQYDISQNVANPAKTDVYGYLSEISLRAQSLINNYSGRYTYTISHSDGQIDDKYQSRVAVSTTNLFNYYERIFFTYSVTERINPYLILLIYFLISSGLLTIGYIRYVNYDFK